MRRSEQEPHLRLVRAELVSALLRTLPPALIMACLYLLTNLLALQATGNRLFALLLVAGAAISMCRIAVIVHGRSLTAFSLDPADAVALELRFALTYLPFAALVGLSSAAIFLVGQDGLRMIAAVLIAGYCAGVAAGVYVRPWICVPSIIMAVSPLTLLAMLSRDPYDRFLALALIAFAAGGIESSLSRYRSDVRKVAQRHKLAALNRQDELTELPNQLALLEAIEMALAEHQGVWLHIVEIRGLGTLNERSGHVAGDDAVRATAAHLSKAVGSSGFVARMAGSNFGILQVQYHSPSEVSAIVRDVADELRRASGANGDLHGLRAFIGSEYAIAGWTAKEFLLAVRQADRQAIT